MEKEYILADTENEKRRLKLLEAEFDEITLQRFSPCKLKEGSVCMEIGIGAGSIAEWLSDKVGLNGRVVAVDKHPYYVNESFHKRTNIALYHEDVTSEGFLDQFNAEFDLIHARFVLVHIQDNERLIDKLVTLLKPGGWLVLEEPDFSTTLPLATDNPPVIKTLQALQGIVMQHGDHDYIGRKLPILFQKNKLVNIKADGYTPISHGKSNMSEMHARTVVHLKDKLIESGMVSDSDIESFLMHCDNPESWLRECQLIGASGQRSMG